MVADDLGQPFDRVGIAVAMLRAPGSERIEKGEGLLPIAITDGALLLHEGEEHLLHPVGDLRLVDGDIGQIDAGEALQQLYGGAVRLGDYLAQVEGVADIEAVRRLAVPQMGMALSSQLIHPSPLFPSFFCVN